MKELGLPRFLAIIKTNVNPMLTGGGGGGEKRE